MKTAVSLTLIALAAALPAFAKDAKITSKANYADVLEACKIKPGDVQAEPAITDGDLVGFKYTVVRPGSAYARAGFKVGDILIEQNGVKLQTPQDIVVAFEAVALGENQLSKVRRGNKVIAFNMKCPKRK